MSRKVTFEGIHNCRDLGGLKSKDGRTIRKGYLYRSEMLKNATMQDRHKLRDNCNVRAVIDLRTTMERMENPNGELPGAKTHLIPLFDDLRAGLTHEKKADQQLETMIFENGFPPLAGLYVNVARQPGCREQLGTALSAVMETVMEDKAVLWHCTEGKDRCGILSAVVLMSLGADRPTILDDYLATNEANGPKAEMVFNRLIARGKDERIARSVREALLAKEEYLQAYLQVIDEEFETPESFITDALGVPEEMLHGFREFMLS